MAVRVDGHAMVVGDETEFTGRRASTAMHEVVQEVGVDHVVQRLHFEWVYVRDFRQRQDESRAEAFVTAAVAEAIRPASVVVPKLNRVHP